MATRLSLAVIAKNAASDLVACLSSAAGVVDEIVVADTGSTDQTREIAAGHGARVVDFPWCDSFAAARNESLRHATGDWIFWLDADEYLDEDNRQKLGGLVAAVPDANVAYVMKQRSHAASGSAATSVDHVRLFRNRPQHRWRYRVHEQILPACTRPGPRSAGPTSPSSTPATPTRPWPGVLRYRLWERFQSRQ